ncbi:unnamed protein product [Rotaria magnacalcarata]|nr:unnamed protein product [Rotaria magnacalcarata]CAF3917544.1 unnamed protein product [Rotaria magnacalcarata]CAF3931972.1 unnamed protein product [Rotaria magnacalcarata]CAF3938620.1 unnamed protein product [Rotaria magnacalcarata]CAF4154735.1 unnamed protein product [Rotaria magnacalcarata]
MVNDSESNIDIESEYDPIEDSLSDIESTFSCTTHTDTVASTTSISSGSTTSTTINNNSFSRPYPPVCRKGIVHEHDKPYFEFGHLSAEFIANDQGFRLPVTYQPYVPRVKGSKIDKFNSIKMAISGFSLKSKEDVHGFILTKFKKEKLRYLCVAKELGSIDTIRRIHIQIIKWKKTTTYGHFVDEFVGKFLPFCDCYVKTNCQCEYQVTDSATAWNEYMKKEFNFIEYGLFHGSNDHGATKQWPETTGKEKLNTITNELAAKAFKKSRTDVSKAALYLTKKAPKQCLTGLSRFQSQLELHHTLYQFKRQEHLAFTKKYCWPDSFLSCTFKLKNDMNKWLVCEFINSDRPLTLILIGGTGTGKTTFALNLPGIVNHYRGHWSRIRWNNKATYIVIDDVPWDKFEDRGFPAHKDLLTGQEYVSAEEKGSKPKAIATKMPAIVLLNPEDARSLLNPSTDEERASLKYWQQRAYIRVMGPDEYFYEPKYVDLSADDKIYTVDDVPIFQKQRRLWHESQEKKRKSMVVEQEDSVETRSETMTLSSVIEEEEQPPLKQQREEQITLGNLGTPEYTYDAWAFL